MNIKILVSINAFYTLCSFFFITSNVLFSQPTSWKNIGPGGGGAFYSPSISPFNPSEVFIPSDMSDLFHTTDLGSNFSIVNFRYITAGIPTKVQFTNQQNILYTINQHEFGNFPVKSTDGGVTWNKTQSDPTDGGAFQIFASDLDFNKVLVTDYSNVFYSTDGGTSFENIFQGDAGTWGSYIAGVLWDGNDIYIVQPDGLLVSKNGQSFKSEKPSGLSSEFIISCSVAKNSGKIRFFAVTNASCYPGMTGAEHNDYKSVYSLDYGNPAWAKKSSGIPSSVHPFFVDMAKDNIDIAYLAGADVTNTGPSVLKTTDGGNTWQSIFKLQNNENIKTGWSGFGGDRAWSFGEYALGFAVSRTNTNYSVITDLGFAHYTIDGGAHWAQMYVNKSDENPENITTPKGKSYHSVGFENTTCWNICWADDKNLFGAYTDIQGTRSSDGGNTWSFDYIGHNDNTMYMSLKHPQSGIMYAATSSVHDIYESMYLTDAKIDGGRGKVLSSTDKGKTWQILHDFGKPVVWLALDPTNMNRMYASMVNSTTGGIYVCDNINLGAASTWEKLAVPPRTQGHPYNIVVLNDGSIVCTYSARASNDRKSFFPSSGVYLSEDGGNTWTDKSDASMQYWTKDIVIDPNDPTQNTWYVSVFSSWGGSANNKGGLYKTTNRGTSWTKLLDKERVESCTISPINPNEMYVTTEYEGLYYTNNLYSKNPEFILLESYPFKHPLRVFFNPFNNSEVYISSFGYGIVRGLSGSVQPLENAVLVSPPDNSNSLSSSVVTLIWEKVSNATKYTIEYADNDNFANSYVDSSIVVTNYIIPNLSKFENKTISWRVKAGNASVWGNYNQVWHLIVTPGTNIDGFIKINLQLFPNPAESNITLISDYDLINSKLSFFNILGEEVNVFIDQEYLSSNRIQFKLDNLPSGYYYIQIEDKLSTKTIRMKFIKQ